MEITIHNQANTIKYVLRDTENHREYVIIHQNGINKYNDETFNLTGYTLYLDTLGLHADETLGEITPERFETIIAYRVYNE